MIEYLVTFGVCSFVAALGLKVRDMFRSDRRFFQHMERRSELYEWNNPKAMHPSWVRRD